MEKLVVLLGSLVLVWSCGATTHENNACLFNTCPAYTLKEENKNFQTRSYPGTKWISTRIASKSVTAFMAASDRLKSFCSRLQEVQNTDLKASWPVLISVKNSGELWLSWFIPPEVLLPANSTSPSVIIQTSPESTIYVRSFDGTPSIESAQTNAETLCAALKKQCTDLPTFSVATYDLYSALKHHNEIWIDAKDIRENAK